MTTSVTSELGGLGRYLRKGRKWGVTEKAVSGYEATALGCGKRWWKGIPADPLTIA